MADPPSTFLHLMCVCREEKEIRIMRLFEIQTGMKHVGVGRGRVMKCWYDEGWLRVISFIFLTVCFHLLPAVQGER